MYGYGNGNDRVLVMRGRFLGHGALEYLMSMFFLFFSFLFYVTSLL